jgi:uncharacterized protein DUF402
VYRRVTVPPVRWLSGDVILWREVWRGRPWLVKPVRVVEHRDDLLAVYLAEGTRLGFPAGSWPWPPGTHPWNRGEDTRWRGHGVLTLHRPGIAHSIWVFRFGEEREFRGWYANLAAPIRLTERGFDTLDHELDVWIRPDRSFELKDEELLDAWVERGRWSVGEVAEIRAEGARIVADAEAGRRWWSHEWASWKPDPSWTALDLPPGWDHAF